MVKSTIYLPEEMDLKLSAEANAAGLSKAEDRIFTLDQRDLRAVQPLTRGITSFRILPADA